jgi:hypothetical protein
MEDMAKLWNEGACMWDQYQHEYFTLKAIIFVCIHDAPGDFIVSGQTKEKSRRPVCISLPSIIQKIVVHVTPAVLGEKT